MHVYDSNRVSVTFAGIVFEGFAEGSKVTVTRLSDQFVDVVGTDGKVSRSKTNDLRADVTVRLMQTSGTNAVLNALLNADMNANGGAGVGALLITDLSGTTVHMAPNAWIVRFPEETFDQAATERAWLIRCADLQTVGGGNV